MEDLSSGVPRDDKDCQSASWPVSCPGPFLLLPLLSPVHLVYLYFHLSGCFMETQSGPEGQEGTWKGGKSERALQALRRGSFLPAPSQRTDRSPRMILLTGSCHRSLKFSPEAGQHHLGDTGLAEKTGHSSMFQPTSCTDYSVSIRGGSEGATECCRP